MASGIDGAFALGSAGEMVLGGLAKAASSKDFWTGGAYTRAKHKWEQSARDYAGTTGYSQAQYQAMKNAKDIARGRVGQLKGNQMATGKTAAQAASEGAQALEDSTKPDQYEMMKSLGNANTSGKATAVNEQYEQARNKLDAGMSGVSSIGNAFKQAAMLGSANNGENDVESN